MDSLSAVLNCIYPFLLQTGVIEAKEQCWVQNQNKAIPIDDKVYLVAQMITPVTYANNVRRKDDIDGTFTSEYTSANFDTVQLDVMSFGRELFDVQPLVLASLKSVTAQQLMAKHGFRVMSLPTTMSDTSALDGGDVINRMTITLQVFNQYGTILKESAYYDQFDKEITINK